MHDTSKSNVWKKNSKCQIFYAELDKYPKVIIKYISLTLITLINFSPDNIMKHISYFSQKYEIGNIMQTISNGDICMNCLGNIRKISPICRLLNLLRGWLRLRKPMPLALDSHKNPDCNSLPAG